MGDHQLQRHSFTMEAGEWARFTNAVKATSPELNCSMALRELVRYWMNPTDAKLRIGWPSAPTDFEGQT